MLIHSTSQAMIVDASGSVPLPLLTSPRCIQQRTLLLLLRCVRLGAVQCKCSMIVSTIYIISSSAWQQHRHQGIAAEPALCPQRSKPDPVFTKIICFVYTRMYSKFVKLYQVCKFKPNSASPLGNLSQLVGFASSPANY